MSTEKQGMGFMRSFIIIIIALVAFSCGRNLDHGKCPCDYSVSIKGKWDITREEVFSAVSSQLQQIQDRRNKVEIIIYSYSRGKEVFSYSDNIPDEIKIKSYSGSIKALVKVRKDGKLDNVYFLSSEGDSKESVIDNLAKEIQKTICSL